MVSSEGGNPPSDEKKYRAVRRGAAREALLDLFLILFTFAVNSKDAVTARALRDWQFKYKLFRGKHGKPTDQPSTLETSTVERER